MVRGALSLLQVANGASAPADEPSSGLRRRRPRIGVWDTLGDELDRSRRYGRPFALLSVSARADDAVEVLSGLVRGVDKVWADDDRVYALLPESTRARASCVVERIRAAAPALAVDVRCVAFPEDAMTGAALLAVARGPQEDALDPAEPVAHGELAPLRVS